jgi:hypothetical protein
MPPPSGNPDDDNDADIAPSCALGLLAGTLALMSAYATALAGSNAGARAASRPLMARKIVDNLSDMRTHPGLGEPMRSVAAKLHRHWSTVAGAEATPQALH